MNDLNSKLDERLMKAVLKAQKTETTEYIVYKKLAKKHSGKNADILERISQDEARHASVWDEYTKTRVKPNRISILFYTLTNL